MPSLNSCRAVLDCSVACRGWEADAGKSVRYQISSALTASASVVALRPPRAGSAVAQENPVRAAETALATRETGDGVWCSPFVGRASPHGVCAVRVVIHGGVVETNTPVPCNSLGITIRHPLYLAPPLERHPSTLQAPSDLCTFDLAIASHFRLRLPSPLTLPRCRRFFSDCIHTRARALVRRWRHGSSASIRTETRTSEGRLFL